ncbi:sensor histidine kinase [Massilia horti]|uniref:Sensor histidine kinase n=1 Tax=Massilia horti TaxID=2562153 RepID=A0A4Y9SSK4_9BURK|nr:histidine kinase [Massilia horti]TFW29428.1 sensor histidine kinase [Massilia horti]
MRLQTDKISIPRGWRIYVTGWLTYMAIVAFIIQIDAVLAKHFDWWQALQSMWSTALPALLLSLLWPVTGYLERKGNRLSLMLGMHLTGAALFALISHAVLVYQMGATTRPASWHAWPFMYSMISYAFIAGIFHTTRANAAVRRQTEAMHQAQTLLIAAELSALRSKLNPHFLFNTLHSIIALTRRDPDAAETALFRFSDMLRYILDTEKSGSDRVTLDAELDFVRDYLELEALRLGPRLSVEWDLDPDAGGCPVPALTLQPLVENSIKHAFNPHSRPGVLRIRTGLDTQAGVLTLSVHDDGPGADQERVRAAPGLGIRTIERRLQLDYGPRVQSRIDTAPGAGFGVSISIPLEEAGSPE